MADARQLFKPQFTLAKTDDSLLVGRDNGIVLKL